MTNFDQKSGLGLQNSFFALKIVSVDYKFCCYATFDFI